jgi:hypothetical protein
MCGRGEPPVCNGRQETRGGEMTVKEWYNSTSRTRTALVRKAHYG